MKLKSLILIALVAIVTLSFSFATTNSSKPSKSNGSEEVNEPIRGFISQDKF